MRKIKAEDLVRELTQDTGKLFSRLRKGKPVLYLSDARIVNNVDLRHHTINKPITIENCEFEGRVDLSSCEFEHAVNFLSCTFRQEFSSGDYAASRSVYRKNFTCSDSIFKKSATFIGMQVEGSAHFDRTVFEYEDKVDFTGATFGGNIECNKAIFKGPASFNVIQCDDRGVFVGTKFEDQRRGVDFRGATFGRNIECIAAVFEGPATFDGLKCGDRGIFNDAKFEAEMTLCSSSFGLDIECNNTEFRGEANFNSLKCQRSGYFSDALFAAEAKPTLVNFVGSSFGQNIECENTIFKRPVSFNSLQCGGTGFFGRTEFGGNVNLRLSSFGLMVDCACSVFGGDVNASLMKCAHIINFADAVFEGRVDFRSLQCGIASNFQRARFKNEVDCRYSRIGGDLDLRGASFSGRVRLGGADISQKLRLGGSCFTDTVELYDTTTKILELMDNNISTTRAVFAGKQIETLEAVKRNPRYTNQLLSLCTNFTQVTKHYEDREESLFIKCREPRTSEGWEARLVDAFVFGSQRVGLQRIEFLLEPDEARDEGGNDKPAEIGKSLTADRQFNALMDEIETILNDENRLRNRLYRKVQPDYRPLNSEDKSNREFNLTAGQPVVKRRSPSLAKGESLSECLLDALFPFKSEKSLDLNEATFERFHGSPRKSVSRELAVKLTEEQDPRKFSRDPYLQLERHYITIGDENDALKMHYEGRCALRKNAKNYKKDRRNGKADWTNTHIWLTDFVWKYSTGYGHRAHRLLWPFTCLVVLGTLIFWPKKALIVSTGSLSDRQHLPWIWSATEQEQHVPVLLRLFDRAVYSLDLLIPLLPVRLGDPRIPNPDLTGKLWWIGVYDGAHSILGWIMVGLLVAWIATLVKSN